MIDNVEIRKSEIDTIKPSNKRSNQTIKQMIDKITGKKSSCNSFRKKFWNVCARRSKKFGKVSKSLKKIILMPKTASTNLNYHKIGVLSHWKISLSKRRCFKFLFVRQTQSFYLFYMRTLKVGCCRKWPTTDRTNNIWHARTGHIWSIHQSINPHLICDWLIDWSIVTHYMIFILAKLLYDDHFLFNSR